MRERGARPHWGSLCSGVVAIVAGLLAGCATIPLAHSEQATLAKLAADLRIAPEEIQSYSRCLVGRTLGATESPRLECLYVRTAAWAAVLDYDKRSKKFSRAFTFDRSTTGVALQTQSTLIADQRQLQVTQKGAVLVVELVNADLGTLGMSGELQAAHDHLRALGIPAMTALPFVTRPAGPSVTYIPIYIPSR